ncbi:MAG: hypothetical protein SFV15_08210 [Polyangiaceae bacterium]|nr:hypothetical protein [Polyangiaceae bacterium]
MAKTTAKRQPGEVRDAILAYLKASGRACSVAEILAAVSEKLGAPVPASSVRSYLGSNVNGDENKFRRVGHGKYELAK